MGFSRCMECYDLFRVLDVDARETHWDGRARDPCMSTSGGCLGRRRFGLVQLARHFGLTVHGVLCVFFVVSG